VAVSYILDAVKARAPIWKREEYADGGAVWKENCECAWAASAPVAASTGIPTSALTRGSKDSVAITEPQFQ